MTDITQSNLYLLLPSKVSRVANMLSEDLGISLLDAIRKVYHSDLYRQLEQEETKLWHEGPVALYNEMTASVS
jgi:hypothetical protein